ncbi:hypothetical protein ACWGKW_35970 [Streptomyces sp. NPDC054766]
MPASRSSCASTGSSPTGRVVARSYSGGTYLAFDPDTTNNSAEVVVNPAA